MYAFFHSIQAAPATGTICPFVTRQSRVSIPLAFWFWYAFCKRRQTERRREPKVNTRLVTFELVADNELGNEVTFTPFFFSEYRFI